MQHQITLRNTKELIVQISGQLSHYETLLSCIKTLLMNFCLPKLLIHFQTSIRCFFSVRISRLISFCQLSQREKCRYSVRTRENTDQKNSEYGHILRSVCCLTQFITMFHFYTPIKGQENSCFLTFSGAVEMKYWTEIG